MDRRILSLFAKAPLPGRVKTRLAPELTEEQAASLYEAMLRDILDQHARGSEPDRALWFTPEAAAAWFARISPEVYRLCVQRGRDLPDRMAGLFRQHADEGYSRIVLRGTDSPTLPLERVGEAFEALERVDLVLCPDRDGGYNLIGLREPCDALFSLELGGTDVLDQTIERARGAGLRSVLLPAHYDVDTAADLEELRADPALPRARRTQEWLRARGSIAP